MFQRDGRRVCNSRNNVSDDKERNRRTMLENAPIIEQDMEDLEVEKIK